MLTKIKKELDKAVEVLKETEKKLDKLEEKIEKTFDNKPKK